MAHSAPTSYRTTPPPHARREGNRPRYRHLLRAVIAACGLAVACAKIDVTSRRGAVQEASPAKASEPLKTRGKGTAHKPNWGLDQRNALFPETGGTVRYTVAASPISPEMIFRLSNDTTKHVLHEAAVLPRPRQDTSGVAEALPYSTGFYLTDGDEMRVVVQLSDPGMMEKFVYGTNHLRVTYKGAPDAPDSEVELEAFDVVLGDYSYASIRPLAGLSPDAAPTDTGESVHKAVVPPVSSVDTRGRWLTWGLIEGDFINLSQSGRKLP